MAMYWDPFRELDRLAASMIDSRQGPRVMPIDLHRDGDHYVLSADLPGVDPGSIDVDIDGQLLTIRAERTLRSDGDVQWLAHERPSGSFLRQLTLGEGLDTVDQRALRQRRAERRHPGERAGEAAQGRGAERAAHRERGHREARRADARTPMMEPAPPLGGAGSVVPTPASEGGSSVGA